MSEAASSRASLLFQQKREFFEAAHQPPPPVFLPIPDTPPGHSSERMSRFDFSMDTNPRRGSSVPCSSTSHPQEPPPKPKRTFAFDIWVCEKMEKKDLTNRLEELDWDAMTSEEKVLRGFWDRKKEEVAREAMMKDFEEQGTSGIGQVDQTVHDGLSLGISTSQLVSRFERLSSDSKIAARPKKFERRLIRPDTLDTEEKFVEMKPMNGNACTAVEPGTYSPLSPCESPLVLKSDDENNEPIFQFKMKRSKVIREKATPLKGGKKAKNEEDSAQKKPMLFETALIVSIIRKQSADGTFENSPDTTYVYGQLKANGSKCITNIGQIIYPDIDHAPQLTRGKHTMDSCDHSFCVALTDEHAVRTYAYCIKFEPANDENEPSEIYFPSVFALVTKTRDPSFFFELAKKAIVHVNDRVKLASFLGTVHEQEHPKKGGMLIVMQRDEVLGTYGKRSEIYCSFGCDKRLKTGWSVNDLVRQLTPEWVVCIIAACLAEQRVLITGSSVHEVSRACNAIDALLRPFQWPFCFVPVIPDGIVEICDTPTPYLVGILRHNLDKIHHLVLEDLGKDDQKNQSDFVLFDIDRGLINPIPLTIKNHKHFDHNEIGRFRHMTEVERETYLRKKNCFSYCKRVGMPRKVAKNLLHQLNKALEKEKSDYDIETCTEAMLHWYASLFGHFKSSGATTKWDKNSKALLVDKQPNPTTRDYLELLVESTAFNMWIDRRVTGYNVAKILGDTTRNMIKFMQNMLVYWEITAISDPSPGFLSLSQSKSDGRIILPAEELEIIDAIFNKFCDEFDYKRKKPVKAAFKQFFGSSRRS